MTDSNASLSWSCVIWWWSHRSCQQAHILTLHFFHKKAEYQGRRSGCWMGYEGQSIGPGMGCIFDEREAHHWHVGMTPTHITHHNFCAKDHPAHSFLINLFCILLSDYQDTNLNSFPCRDSTMTVDCCWARPSHAGIVPTGVIVEGNNSPLTWSLDNASFVLDCRSSPISSYCNANGGFHNIRRGRQTCVLSANRLFREEDIILN